MFQSGARRLLHLRKTGLLGCGLTLTLALGAAPAAAQRAATLTGSVYTLTGNYAEAWPNARLTLKSSGAGVTYGTVTDETGGYTFDEILPGAYELTIALEGIEIDQRQVELAAGETQRHDVRLHPRGVREAVRGGGSPSPPNAMPATALKTAPLMEEKFEEAAPLAPGVERGPDGLLNMRGARSVQSGAYVNGSSVVDPVNERTAVSLPIEAADAARVVSHPYAAESQRYSDAVVVLDTRSGTDRWHYGLGSIFPRFRFRDGHFNGLRAITPHLTFGGPLARGKLYLFQALDYRYVQTQIESPPALPERQDETGLEAFDSFTRGDWNVNGSHRVTGSFAWFPQNLTFVNLNNFNPQAVTPNFRQRGYFSTAGERWIFSGGGHLDSTYSVKRFDAHVFSSTPGPALLQGLFLFPEQNFGAWNSQQDRESIEYRWKQDLHLRPLEARGTHSVQVGYRFARSRYLGSVANFPVTVLRNDATASQRIDFFQPEEQAQVKNDFAFYAHDRWQMSPRMAMDAGVRVDREDVSGDAVVVAPRLALTIVPTRDNRTVIRAGAGLYYDHVPLYLRSFTDYPVQILTRFAADGLTVVDGPKPFAYRVATRDGKLRVPYSVVATVELDRELASGLVLRLGYKQRETYRDFVVDPFESVAPAVAEFQLRNSGRQSYREFLAMLGWRATERTSLYLSYVRSQARGDLNTFDQFFGNYPTAIIRPNERNRSPLDVPDRLLIWGTIGLPLNLELLPVVDVRSGYPFSAVDDDLNFVGPRNRAGRYPTFLALDVQVSRRFVIPFAGRQWHVVAGARFYNVTNHFNPRDVQQVVTHPLFGQFFNTADRQFRLRFEILF